MTNLGTSNEKIERMKKRTEKFAKDVRIFVDKMPKKLTYFDDFKQVIRSSGSIAANYLEACEAVSEPDRMHRLRICRKESRETVLWFDLFHPQPPPSLAPESKRLRQEASEFVLIFNAVIRNKLNKKIKT
jgi:four helix bundle protein